jgi:hypothetical protein
MAMDGPAGDSPLAEWRTTQLDSWQSDGTDSSRSESEPDEPGSAKSDRDIVSDRMVFAHFMPHFMTCQRHKKLTLENCTEMTESIADCEVLLHGSPDEPEDGPDHNAIIGDNASDPVPFCSDSFQRSSRRYRQQLRANANDADIRVDPTVRRESLVQFLDICQGRDNEPTEDTLFEILALCDQWRIDTSYRSKVTAFMQDCANPRGIVLGKLLFCLRRGDPTGAMESQLRANLLDFLQEPQLVDVPVPVICRLVDFGCCDARLGIRRQLLTFCVRYFNRHGPSASPIFQTLHINRLMPEDLAALCSLDRSAWWFIGGSVGEAIAQLRNELEKQRQQIAELVHLRTESQQYQRDNAKLKNELEQQKKDFGKLRTESQQHQRDNAKLKTEMEHRQKHNDRLEAELGKQQDENAELRAGSEQRQKDNDRLGA